MLFGHKGTSLERADKSAGWDLLPIELGSYWPSTPPAPPPNSSVAAMKGFTPLAKSRQLQALECALVLLLLLPTSSQSYIIYKICSSVRLSCGERSIDPVVAPFRTDEQPEACGRKLFRLFCHGEYPVIQINSGIYWVKSIDYQNKILTLVNMDFVGNLCPSEFTSTTLDISPFGFNFDVQRVTIRYNCSCPGEGNRFWELPCPANASSSYAYLAAQPFTEYPYWRCSCPGAEINVSVRQSEFEELANGGSIDAQSFMEVLLHGFKVMWPFAEMDCDACRMSGGICALDVGGRGQSCSCESGSYSPVCPSPGAAKWGTLKKKVVIGIVLGIGGFFVVSCVLLFLYLYFRRCNMLYGSSNIMTGKNLKHAKFVKVFFKKYKSLPPKMYSYVELEKITKSFSNIIGKGGFATVFKGKLSDGRSVAVKDLSNSKSNGKDFVTEVVSIGCTYHVNIVRLLGYCAEGTRRFLIYEFMPNGSLERFLFGNMRGTLGWEKLYEIAIGIARGLDYLHHGCQRSIFHFDIKPHNILLDHEFCPKISDFGLAKLCGMNKDDILMSAARGTPGYIAPEVFNPNYRRASGKSDVYSYGMMVLDMVGGKGNIERRVDHTSEIHYLHWMGRHLDLDRNFELCGALTEEEKVISRRMVRVGLWCIQLNPADRPSIKKVVDVLEGRMEDVHMPPMAVLCSPSGTSEVTDYWTSCSHEGQSNSVLQPDRNASRGPMSMQC